MVGGVCGQSVEPGEFDRVQRYQQFTHGFTLCADARTSRQSAIFAASGMPAAASALGLASGQAWAAAGGQANMAAAKVSINEAIRHQEAALEKLYTKSAYEPKVQRVATRLWTKVKSGQ
mgnify:CR=1 FL=1